MGKKYFFLGIGGISMSALARLETDDGHHVCGSDAVESDLVQKLSAEGIAVNQGDYKKQIDEADFVVASSAIPQDDEQLTYAKNKGKTILSRGQLLGEIASTYQNVIAVSGAHGKTTTTGLIASIFCAAEKNPTLHIGGILSDCNSNVLLGGKEFFITEACEYKDNFLYLNPTFGVVLNVEPEHLDYFKNFEGVKRSFKRFISQCEHFIAPIEFGGKSLKFSCKNLKQTEKGLEFDCLKEGDFFAYLKCQVYGLHNVQNILTAVEVADYFGVDKVAIAQGLKNFKGIKRRFEKFDLANGTTLIFDYAHHPSEIEKSIATVKNFCKGHLTVIFQPHTYSRTKALFPDFVKVLQNADRLIIFKTYSARENYDYDGDARRLYEALEKVMSCEYSEDYMLLKKLTDIQGDDCVLVLGAGDFYDKCRF